MEKPKRIPWTQLVAATATATALGTYLTFAPSPAYAVESCSCVYAGASYSEGACRGGQSCACSGSDGVWVTNASCPAE